MRTPVNFDTDPKFAGPMKGKLVYDFTGGVYVDGDVFNGQTYDSKANPTHPWLPATKVGGVQEGAALGTAVLGAPISGATPDTLLHGVQSGDSPYAASLKAQADLSAEQAARAEVDAQRGYQLGSRDARVEADKDAATRAAAAFNQKMAQTSGAAGGGAAVLASANVQDAAQTMAEHRARSDAQHLVGAQHQQAAELAKQHVVEQKAAAEEATRSEREQGQQQLAAQALAQGQTTGKNVSTALAPYTLADMQDYVDQRAGRAMTHGGDQNRVTTLADLVAKGEVDYDDVVAEISKVRAPTPSDRRVKRLIRAVSRRF